MPQKIHPTSIVSPTAELGHGVEVGPFSVIGEDVQIGEGTCVGPHCVIQGPTKIGRENLIYGQSALGTDPQDLKYRGEVSTLLIGDRNKIREFVTVNRGTEGGIGKTVLGSGNLLMTEVHVAHDCVIGDEVILANAATLAGHVIVGNRSSVGAFCGIHQFCRVGDYAFVGGYSVLTRDALPFVKTVGIRNDAGIYGINAIGLERRGFSRESVVALKRAYRWLFAKGLTVSEAVEAIEKADLNTPEVKLLLQFIENSERGFVR